MVAAITVGCKTWHPPSLRQPSASWWDSVWAFTGLLPNEFPLKLMYEAAQTQTIQDVSMKAASRLCVCVCGGTSCGKIVQILLVCTVLSWQNKSMLLTSSALSHPSLLSLWCRNHYFLWTLFAVFSWILSSPLDVSLTSSWHRIKKKNLLWSSITGGISRDLDLFCFLFIKRRWEVSQNPSRSIPTINNVMHQNA